MRRRPSTVCSRRLEAPKAKISLRYGKSRCAGNPFRRFIRIGPKVCVPKSSALQAGGTNEASSRSHSHHRLPQPGHGSTSLCCHPTGGQSGQPERDRTAKPDLRLIHRPQRAWQLRNFARVGVPRARDTKPNRPRWHRGPELRRERACHRGQHEPCERPRGSGTVRRRLLPPAREVGRRPVLPDTAPVASGSRGGVLCGRGDLNPHGVATNRT
jgi:hypothetical protein